MNALLILWNNFFDICRFRRGPQDLPASPALMWMALGFHTLISAFVSMLELSFGLALLSGIVDSLLLVILTVSLLIMTRRPERIRQTLAALAGIGVIIGMFSTPLIYWINLLQAMDADPSLPVILLLGIGIWGLSVFAHILRHALSVEFGVGILTALVFYIISFSIMYHLFPLPEA